MAPIPDGPPVETHQKITADGQMLAYTTHAGFLALRNATTGQSEAHVFFTSYSKDGVTDASSRPLFLFFGGAPGVAAAWQEFGGLGPKKVKLDGEAAVDNPQTILTHADLVFVNPVGTGYSRPDQPGKGPSFWNSAADVASLGDFVRTYLGRNGRRTSPLFIGGEDAATARVAGLAAYLEEHDIPVRGVALLNMKLSADATAGDAQYITLLPSLVMSAWVHKKLSPALNAMSAEEIASQARQFASREYLHGLYKGDRMTAEERAKVVADLSRLTGLSKSFVVANDLRISLDRFNTELMRDQHRGLSKSDARVTGFMPGGGGGRGGGGGGYGGGGAPALDFNMSMIEGPFLNAYEAYLHRDLGFVPKNDELYYLTHGGVGEFTANANGEASLAQAFARAPGMRLFVGVNFYDLTAPFYATEYTLAHLNVSPEVRAHNISISHYEAGEMAYMDEKALAKLQRDLATFVTQK